MKIDKLPVAVIGAGPVGLAAVAHLLERGLTPVLFESGESVGASVSQWGHVRMFSPWKYNVDAAGARLLGASGWQAPDEESLPTGNELVERYLRPFAALPAVRDHIHLNTRVVAISRRNLDKVKDGKMIDGGRDDAPFVLQVVASNGEESLVEAKAVIDASGTWLQPNPLGSGGLPAIGEKRHTAHIYYGIPNLLGAERSRYAGKRVLVVGSGHSAINALLDLAQLKKEVPDTTIHWAIRGTNLRRLFGGGEDDALPARGQLGTRIHAHVEAGTIHLHSPFRISQITRRAQTICVTGESGDGHDTLEAENIQAEIEVDELIAATGASPNLEMLREVRLDLDPALESARLLAPMIDPNLHSCGTVPPHGEAELRQPEKGLYLVGSKSYGRAPTFLLATGYEQVRSVVAALAGDWEAAANVALLLPETGVCGTDGDGCCSTPIQQAEVISLFRSFSDEILLQPFAGQETKLLPQAGCCS